MGPGELVASQRTKINALEEAFTGHHAFLLAKMLARVDQLNRDIAEVEELIAPFEQAVERLDDIPGIGRTAASLILSEIGLDMTRFPTAGHLASWARFAPTTKESAGRKKGRSATGHGNPYLARVLGEAAVSADKTNTFLGERYRPHRPPPRQEESHRRRRPLHHLAPVVRPQRSLHRPGR
ncbi:transposase [Nonomuraea angiospora]